MDMEQDEKGEIRQDYIFKNEERDVRKLVNELNKCIKIGKRNITVSQQKM